MGCHIVIFGLHNRDDNMAKTKKMMFCPWCEEGQARTWQGMTAHVRAKHNDKINELKDNKEMYLEKFACDEFGNPIGGSPEPEPPEPKPDPEPEPKTKPPAKGVKPPEPKPDPEPEPKTKPAEGGGFLDDLRRSVFGD
jgi:hypothetical protein